MKCTSDHSVQYWRQGQSCQASAFDFILRLMLFLKCFQWVCSYLLRGWLRHYDVDNNVSRSFCAVAHLCCSPPKMLLRMMWCRSGAQLSVNRKPGFIFASTSFVQTAQSHKYGSQPRTQSNLCGTWIFSRNFYINARHKHQRDTRHVLPAVGGLDFTDPWTTPAKQEQRRFYSSNIVKSMLKPALKAPSASGGKRVPKGPRTKQPSRANQPALSKDQVDSQTGRIYIFEPTHNNFQLLNSFAGYDAVYCLRNGRSVSSPNTLPRPDQPWLPWDRSPKRYSWKSLFPMCPYVFHRDKACWELLTFFFFLQMPQTLLW